MIHFITYISTAIEGLTLENVRDILSKSRKNNPQLGLTGLLLYVEGDFIQTLEGPKENIDTLYQTICLDPRHFQIMKILEGQTEERQFGSWAMTGRSLSQADILKLEGIGSYDHKQLFAEMEDGNHPALKIMDAISPKIDDFELI